MKLDLARKRPSLLARLWLRLGALLGRTLLLLLVIGLLGWALSSAWFAWHHRGPVAVQEQVPADEAARTQDIIQTAVRIVDQHREGTRYLRDAHAKAHGCVKAQVQVLNDLSPPLRQGVFATPGQTWHRRTPVQRQRLPAVRQYSRRPRHGDQATGCSRATTDGVGITTP